MQNETYNLTGLLTFQANNIERLKPIEFSYIEKKQNKTAKSIHWLPAEHKNIATEITMPDGTILKGLSEPTLDRIKVNTIVQFERLGFAKLHKKSANKLEFFFTHP